MAPEQTNAKRHGPNRATTVICLVLILAAALVIARMVKFRSQVDVTLPAVLWEVRGHGREHHSAFPRGDGEAVGAG